MSASQNRVSDPTPAVAEILIVPSTVEGLLVWTAAELQAERDYVWYASCCPGSFVRRYPPSMN